MKQLGVVRINSYLQIKIYQVISLLTALSLFIRNSHVSNGVLSFVSIYTQSQESGLSTLATL